MMNTDSQKPKMGRPVVVGDDAVVISVRLSREQEKAVLRASKKAGKKKSEWLRQVVFEAAQAA